MNIKSALAASTMLLLTIVTAAGHDASYYAAHSRLASGRWVKVKVTDTGMQQIDDATLAALGFARPDEVKVYGYGGALLSDDRFSTDLPDDLPRQMSIHTGGKLIFYGQAADRHTVAGLVPTVVTSPYSFEGCYFLTDTPDPTPLPTPAAYSSAVSAVDTHTALYVINRERQNIINSGERWYDSNLSHAQATHYSFPTADAVTGSQARLTYNWGASTDATISINLTPTPIPAATGTALSAADVDIFSRRSGYINFNVAGADSLHADILLQEPRPRSSKIAVDWIGLAYTRANTLGGDAQRRMTFSASAESNIHFTDLPAGARVWDVTSPARVFPYAISSDGSITPATSLAHTVIAFNPSAELYTPQVVGSGLIAAQDLHAMATPQMLILTHRTLHPYAEALAETHRSLQGLDVAVVDVEEVYNEFSSGTLSAIGLRRFVKMLYDRDPARLRSLLLYGAASYDMRGITHSAPVLPNRQCSQEQYMYNVVQSYSADSYYGMLNDSYNPLTPWRECPQIAVGRLPVTSPEECLRVNEKVNRFITTPNWRRASQRHMLICDNVDDMQYSECMEVIADTLALRPATSVHKNYADFFPKDYHRARPTLNALVAQQVDEGIGFIHYLGHSDRLGLVDGNYGITAREVSRWTNSTLPIALLSTCTLGRHDAPYATLGPQMVLAPNGAIAVLGYARESWAIGNYDMHRAIAREIAHTDRALTLGELWLNTRRKVNDLHIYSTRYSINDLNYTLLGDPELPLPLPSPTMAVKLAPGLQSTLSPLNRLVAEAVIQSADGVRDTTFSGTAYVSLLQEEIPTPLRGLRQPSVKGHIYKCGSRLVAQCTLPVKAGRADISLIVPTLNDGAKLRLAIHAESADGALMSAGQLTGLNYSTPADGGENALFTPPAIASLRVGGSDNVATRPTDMISAEITPGTAGMALSGATPGIESRIVIDGNITRNIQAYTHSNPDGTISLSAPIGSLPDGRHTATLSVVDNAGNRAESTATFEVVTASVTVGLECLTPVARDKATFAVTHSYLSTDPKVTILIADRRGVTVARAALTASEGAEWSWDLRDLSGQPLPAGTYTATALTTDELRYGSSSSVTFTILP